MGLADRRDGYSRDHLRDISPGSDATFCSFPLSFVLVADALSPSSLHTPAALVKTVRRRVDDSQSALSAGLTESGYFGFRLAVSTTPSFSLSSSSGHSHSFGVAATLCQFNKPRHSYHGHAWASPKAASFRAEEEAFPPSTTARTAWHWAGERC